MNKNLVRAFFISSFILFGSKETIIAQQLDHIHTDGYGMHVEEISLPNGTTKKIAVCNHASHNQFVNITNEKTFSERKIDVNVKKTTRHKNTARFLSTITVNYIGNWPDNAQTAFEKAVDIWAETLNSSVGITIDANWVAQGPGLLGSASATSRIQNFPNAPIANTFYPIALANSLAGADLSGASDVVCNFNSSRTDWYFGLDAQAPNNQIDFISVVLHELGHGFGFAGSGFINGAGEGSISNPPTIYDRLVIIGNGQPILNFVNDPARLAQEIRGGGLGINSSNVLLANFNVPGRLFSPATFQGGSSYSHWDEGTYNGTINSLMTPSLEFGPANHDIGTATRGLFRDMGWIIGSQPYLTAGVNIVSSNRVCIGETTTFTTSATNGGSKPQYQWYIKRGENLSKVGTNAAAFSSNNLLPGDELQVEIVSNNSSVFPPNAISELFPLNVSNKVLPTIKLEVEGGQENIIPGQEVKLIAKSTYAGNEPKFFWQVNVQTIQETTDSSISINSLKLGDKIRVVLRSSDPCRTVNTVISNEIIVGGVTSITNTSIELESIQIYPNPVTDIVNINFNSKIAVGKHSLVLYNSTGIEVLKKDFVENNYQLNVKDLAAGTYFLKIANNSEIIYYKIIKL